MVRRSSIMALSLCMVFAFILTANAQQSTQGGNPQGQGGGSMQAGYHRGPSGGQHWQEIQALRQQAEQLRAQLQQLEAQARPIREKLRAIRAKIQQLRGERPHENRQEYNRPSGASGGMGSGGEPVNSRTSNNAGG